jgi:isopenicillin N synthase-like dioxygenase
MRARLTANREMSIPVIDISPFLASPIASPSAEALKVAHDINKAFSTWGFCQITGHKVSTNIQKDLVRHTKDFFAQPEALKLALHVKNGGVAWRGYMPQGGEGTHGNVDQKAGMYFGPEHPSDHPQSGLPLHGKNQFPDATVPGMRPAVLQYIEQVTELGKAVCDALSLSFQLDGHFIRDKYLQPEPVAFFRTWKYALSAEVPEGQQAWGIGEHSGELWSLCR